MCLGCSCPELTSVLLHEAGAECLIVTPTQLSAGNTSTGNKREFCYQTFCNRCQICTFLKKILHLCEHTTEEASFCGAQFIGWTIGWGPLLCSFPIFVKENAKIVCSSRP